MSKGFFDLEGLEEMSENAILKTNINEGSEFAPNSNATNNVDNGTPDTKVSIPGGDSEKPTAKPEGGEQGPSIPQDPKMNGETYEKPKGEGEHGPSTPKTVELTADVYNSTLEALQKSFQESVELLGMLRGAKIVEKTTEQLQAEYTEQVLAEAMLQAYEDGPMFEAVKRGDKKDVKKVVRAVRGKLSDWCDENKVKFEPASLLMKYFNVSWWTTRFWQIVGAIYVEGGNVEKVVNQMNKDLDEHLGEYKIIPSGVFFPTIVDLFKVKFNWKNQKNVYMLLIDKKLPFEFTKEEQLKVVKEIGDDKKAKGKDEPKTESTECEDGKCCPKCGKDPCECDKDKGKGSEEKPEDKKD